VAVKAVVKVAAARAVVGRAAAVVVDGRAAAVDPVVVVRAAVVAARVRAVNKL
jgi:hypothetical protein